MSSTIRLGSGQTMSLEQTHFVLYKAEDFGKDERSAEPVLEGWRRYLHTVRLQGIAEVEIAGISGIDARKLCVMFWR
jgi:hypothetical protein